MSDARQSTPTATPSAAELRQRAGGLTRAGAARPAEHFAASQAADTRQTRHKLQVHQIELETQNEELRRAQAELEAARARYFDLYDLAPVGYVTVSDKGVILEANLTAAALLGVTRGALVRQPLPRFIFPADQDIYFRHRKQLADTGAPQACELRLVRSPGAPFWAHLETSVAADAGSAPLCRVVLSDITARKQAEEELQESKALMEAVVENTPLMIFLKEATELRFVILNRAGEELLGYDRRDLLGRNNLDLFPPEQAAHFMANDREVLDGEADMLDIPEEPILTATKGQRLLHTRKVCIRGTDGTTKYLLGISEDITEHKLLEAQFAQAQKMESVGRLAGGVAHDFNNLLTGIMGYAELCRDELPPEHPIRDYLDEITHDAQRSADITQQLLAFARIQVIVPKVLDVNDALEGMLKMLRHLIGEDIDLAWLPGAGLWPVKMDAGQLDQVMANLCVNARDAIAGVGKVSIETENVTLDQAYCATHRGVVPGDYVLLAVSDDGCGMSQDVRERIFEPFFTTKPVGQGTGLGLSTVYGIVRQNAGWINVYSEPGQGTTFRTYLPRTAMAAAPEPGTATPAELPRGTETVLLAEDERSVRITARRFLELLGYTVLVAATPAEALRLAGAHAGPIHLLISDMVMPGLSGRDLAARLVEQRPDAKCLFMSGYTADAIMHRGTLDTGMQFLSKPFSRGDLARKVRAVLEGRP